LPGELFSVCNYALSKYFPFGSKPIFLCASRFISSLHIQLVSTLGDSCLQIRIFPSRRFALD